MDGVDVERCVDLVYDLVFVFDYGGECVVLWCVE